MSVSKMSHLLNSLIKIFYQSFKIIIRTQLAMLRHPETELATPGQEMIAEISFLNELKLMPNFCSYFLLLAAIKIVYTQDKI
jgi:hypothetical protein